jgi:type I restriction enzyme S subunit
MKEIKLGEVLDVKRGTSLSGKFYENSGKYIRLTLGNFTYPECGWKDNTSKDDLYYSGDFKKEYLLKKDDIITPLTEQVRGLLGNTARIPESDLYIQSGDIGKIIPFEKLLDKNFAYYLVSSPIVKKQLDAASQQTKIRHTSPDAIKNCVAFIPELASQKKIANLLDSLNKKISTNNRIISELESLAKTIYDYWFLQFDFPDENGRPYKSSGGKMVWNEELKREIPEGWEVNELCKVFDITMGSSPKGESLNENHEGIEFYQGSTDFGDLYPIQRVYTTAPVRLAKAQDILISVRAPVGDMNIAMNDCCIGRGLAAVHYKSSLYTWNTLLTLKPYFDIFNGAGTTFGALTSDGLKQQHIVKPSNNIIEKYISRISGIELELRTITIENQQLTSLRDFLLPMLMNGQVTFKGDA